MLGISVGRFRSFEQIQRFHIRPLTIFLGRNSSGKSTAIRLVPLLQQTFEQRTSAPLLWNGGLVDFGSYEEVRPKGREQGPIIIGFEIPAPNIIRHKPATSIEPSVLLNGQLVMGYTARLIERRGGTRLRGIDITLGDDSITIEISDKNKFESVRMNNEDYSAFFCSGDYFVNDDSLFPAFRFIEVDPEQGYSMYRQMSSSLNDELLRFVGEICHGGTSTEKKRGILEAIPYAPRENFAASLQKMTGASDFFRKKLLEKGIIIEKIRQLRLLSLLSEIIESAGRTVEHRILNSAYIDPSRAAGERYYRWQELAVDRLDPKGENLAMYLRGC